MTKIFDLSGERQRLDSVTVPRIWFAVVVSVVIHALLLWRVPAELKRPSELADRDARGPLIVELMRPSPPRAVPAPPKSVAPARPAPPRSRPRPPTPPPRVAQKPRATPPAVKSPPPRPPVLARRTPEAPAAAPRVPTPKPAPAPPAPAPRKAPPTAGDLLAYVEQQRRSRGFDSPEPDAPRPSTPAAEESANARANRLAAANLGLGNKPAGGERRSGGGIFDIRRMGYDYAEFMFYGWNRHMQRNNTQIVEVHKGGQPSIELAVVRRMISIIRDHETGDFIWESQRLGRNVTLSARQRDTAGLESFLMQEFFEGRR